MKANVVYLKCEVIVLNDRNNHDPITSAAQKDPRVAKAMAQLSEQDAARLREVLADPEKTKQILSTPLAQQMLRRLSGGGKNNT